MTLLATMTKHDKLVVGYTPYNEMQTSAVFSLKNHRQDLVKMQTHCK